MPAPSSRRRHVAADPSLAAEFGNTPWRLEWSERADGSRSWELRRRTGDRKRLTFKTLNDAREYAARWTLGQRVPKDNLTFKAVVRRYQAARSDEIAPATARAVDSHLELHVLPYFGSTPVREIGTEDIVLWLRGLKRADGKPMASGSKHKVLSALLSVLRYACETAHAIPVIPAVPKQYRPTKSKPGGRALTDQEVDRVTAACPTWLQDIVDVTLSQALRVGEVCGLQWQDVDFAARTLTVARQSQDGQYRPTKTGTVETIRLRPLAHKTLLRKWNEDRPAVTDNIFGQMWPGNVGDSFRKYAKQAGVKATMHDLRRTCVTGLANTPGLPLAAVRDFARHSSLEETQKYVRAGHTPPDVLAALDGERPMRSVKVA